MRWPSEHHGRAVVLAAGLAVAWVALLVGEAFAAREAPPATSPAAATWLTDFDEAGRQSRIRNEPILAVSTMSGCPYCRMFAAALSAPDVVGKLAQFVLFRLDLDQDWETARRLGVGAAPVSLVIAPNGVTAARADGCMARGPFLDWLAGARKVVLALDPAGLAARPPAELAQLLGARDPVVRQAATQALTAQPAAAPAVLEAMGEGGLAVRLGALEVLRLWGAPVAGLDPWKPETIPAAVEALRPWAADPQTWPQRPKPSVEEVERDLALWTDGEEGPEGRAAYERLAQAGPELLPRVRELTPTAWDRRGERLAALRYRLLMPSASALRLPQVPFQMAARDAQTRAAALGALADSGGAGLDGFFLEAFGDADAKVREAALRGLRKAGGQVAREHVLGLLDDPSPNVRATVLKELVESPLPDAADALAAYALRETDEDLVVHATQALRMLRNQANAFEALAKLTEHESWRVRAAAVESFGPVSTSGREPAALPKGKNQAIAQMLERALKDDDVFVVSKAMEVIGEMDEVDLSACLEELTEVARTRPELTLQALQTMAGSRSMRAKAAGAVKELSRHESPDVRAAAVRALATLSAVPDTAGIAQALEDPAEAVRLAACEALVQWGQRSAGSGSVRRLPLSAQRREALAAALRKAASSESLPLRFWALMALGAVGEAEAALAGIQEVVTRDASYASKATALVQFLPWPKRKDGFLFLRQSPMDDEAWMSLFSASFEGAPRSEEDFFWQVFSDDPHVLASPYQVLEVALRFYGLTAGLWNPQMDDDAKDVARLADRAREQLKSPNARRAALGLVLLCRASRRDGEAEARRIVDAAPDAGVEDELRTGALEVLLCYGLPSQEAIVERTLASPDEKLRLAAFSAVLRAYTPFKPSLVVHVGQESVWTEFLRAPDLTGLVGASAGAERGKKWDPPALPEWLTLDAVRPFLSAPDPQTTAGAAYIMALLKEPAGLDRLVEAWRMQQDDRELRLALAQAVAVSDNDDNIGLVREVYESLESNEKEYWGPELYWGIRRLDGPKARQLRKEMREKLGSRLFY